MEDFLNLMEHCVEQSIFDQQNKKGSMRGTDTKTMGQNALSSLCNVMTKSLAVSANSELRLQLQSTCGAPSKVHLVFKIGIPPNLPQYLRKLSNAWVR